MFCPDMIETTKRARSNLVCNFCKRRKVKCDKGTPCSACVKYGNPICEYPPEPVARASKRAKKKDFGELVLQLDSGPQPYNQDSHKPPVQRNRSSTNSSVSSSSTSNPPSVNIGIVEESPASSMHSELEFLKSKISMLENSLSGRQSTGPSPTAAQKSPCSAPLPIWQNPSGNNQDLSFMHGVYPCLSDSQYFSFHNSYVPIISMGPTSTRHYHPLHWVSLIKMYSSISPLFAMKQKKYIKERQVILNADLEPTGPSDRVFNKKLREFVGDEGDYKSASPAVDVSKAEKFKHINQRARAVGLTVYEGDLDSEHDILRKAALLLPTRKVIWMLIDRFFYRVYPFFPFLDQTDFEAQVVSILGSRNTDHVRVDTVHISKKIEIIYLGTLFIVLRLAYLTLFTNDDAQNEANLYSNDPSPEAQRHKFLMENPIDVDVFSVAQLCLFQFGFLRSTNIPILQLCLYLKVYNSFAPENGEGADDSNSSGFSARLIEMAQSLGLHREPNNFRTKVRDDKTNNLCRKIWWYLVLTDIISGLTNGAPLSVKRSQFDTLPPFYTEGNENIKDIELEKQVVESMAKFDHCFDRIYEVVSVISDVKAPLPMKELCQKLSALEIISPDMMTNSLKWLHQPGGVVPQVEIGNAHSLKIGFQATFFSVSVNLHFYNHYEKMNEMDLAYFYLKKIIIASVHNMMPFYEKFVENTGALFLNTTDIAITPSFQTLVHKCSIIIHCVQMRSRFSIIKCEMSPVHQRLLDQDPEYRRRFSLLNETFVLCETCLVIFMRSMKKMMSRYYYCWRYLKAQEKLKSIRNGTEYYLSWCKGKESYMLLSNEMLDDLNGILKKSIEIVQKNEVYSEAVPDLTNGFHQDGADAMSSNTPGGASSTFESNDQFLDAMWSQMSSMKPDMSQNVFSNSSSHPNAPADFMGMDTAFDANAFEDLTAAGAGFYDSLFKDLMVQATDL